jgi:signal transduction histidine kinase
MAAVIVSTVILLSILLFIVYMLRNAYLTVYIKGRQLEHCINELERIKKYDIQKTEFFTNISHELKTPLSVILGAIQLLEQNNSAASIERRKSGKNLQIIKQNSYRLLRLINNFLDISRIDSGYAKLCMINCNIVKLIKEISASVEPYAELKHIDLEFISETDELIAAVDIDKIERVILNLLSNAIKFTPTGGKITISVQGEDNKNVIISVKDTGVGIPKSLSEKIFERFVQVGNSYTREHEGTGIGLYLVKSFVDLHNGSIELNSDENSGSEFIITLPIKNIETPSECVNSANRTEQKRVIETINIELSDIYSAVS